MTGAVAIVWYVLLQVCIVARGDMKCSVVTGAVAIVWYVLLQVCILARGDMKCVLW